jgi:hypothetical protein
MKQASWERAWVVKPQGLNKISLLGIDEGDYPRVCPEGAVTGSVLAPRVAKPRRGNPVPPEAGMI